MKTDHSSAGPSRAGAQPLFLRIPEVVRITGLSRSSIYVMIAKRSFPKPCRISTRAVGWLYADLELWRARCKSLEAAPLDNGPAAESKRDRARRQSRQRVSTARS